jgi:hypothetical protein
MSSVKIKLHEFHSGQQNIALNRGKRTVIRAGRRFGKTVLLEDVASKFAIDGKSVGWFTPKYKYLQGSFRRLKSNLKPIIERASATDGIIELITGGIIRFWTLEDEDAGRGDSYDEVIIDEASLVKKGLRDIWEQSIAPTLMDRDGNAWMSGTPKGVDADNFFYFACNNKDSKAAQVWKEFHAPTFDNPHISEKALAEFKHDLPPLVYQQEVLAEFVDWSGVAFFALQSLLVDGKPVQYPKNCSSILVILDTATKIKKTNDGTSVVFCAFNPIETHTLTILDYDYIQIEGASLELWLPSVMDRAEELAVECKARVGVVKRIEDKASGSILLQQCQRNFRKATTQKEADRWNAQPIPEELVAMGKEGRAIDVSGFVFQGKIKFSEYAFNKVVNFKGITKNHLLSQIIGFRFNGESTDENDDLLDGFTYSCQMAKK